MATTYEQVLANAQARADAARLQRQQPLVIPPQRIIPDGKMCSTCRQWRKSNEFSPHKRMADKLKSECRYCHNAKVKKAALRGYL